MPVARTCRNETPGLGRIVRTLCEDLDDASAFAQHAVVRHVEDTLFGLLLAELPHNYSEQFNRGVGWVCCSIAVSNFQPNFGAAF